MASGVTAPLERQFGQLPGLKQMTSISSSGSSIITLQFDLALSIDVAEQQVQAAINAATTFLPRDLPNPPVYSKVNPADAPVLTLGVTSSSLPLTAVQDLVDTRLVQKIAQLPGVGLVTLSGGQKPAVRIQVNPARLAANGLTMDDVDLWELNEAFAAVVLRWMQALDLDPERVNVNGGAIAMGHPLGATGGMILGTMVDELERANKERALVTLCVGAGMGTATVIERV